MFCRECGSEVSPTDKYCVRCGRDIQSSYQYMQANVSSINGVYGASDPQIRKSGHVRIFVTIGICFFLFLFLTASSLVYVIRRTFSEENIAKVIAEIDVVLLMDDLGVYDGIVDAIAGEGKNDRDDRIEDENNDDEQSLIKRIWEDDAVREFVADNVTDYVGSLIKGDRELEITRDDVLDFVGRSAGLIQEKIDARLEEDADDGIDIYEEIEEYINKIDIPDDFIEDSSKQTDSINMDLIRLPMKQSTIIILLSLTGLSFAAIILVNLRNISNALIGLGSSLLAASAACSVFGFRFYSIASKLTEGTISIALAENLFSPTRSIILNISLGFLIPGAVLIALFAMFNLIAHFQKSESRKNRHWN